MQHAIRRMNRSRHLSHVFALALLALGISSARADQGTLNWQINSARRMAAVDRLSDTGWQPRVWSVAYGDYLVSKRTDDNTGSWTINMSSVTSGVDVASFSDGSTQFQRVFFARQNRIAQLVYDNDAFNTWGFLPLPSGGQVFSNTDVAAVHWVTGSTHRYAVAAVATNGSVCIWNGTSTTGITATPHCSLAGVASTSE